jgi:uncharacterized membrane protein
MRPGSLVQLKVALTASGLGISAYLTLLHYDSSVPLACGQGTIVDCESVLTSPASMALGLPMATWGLLWFGVALVLAWLSARRLDRWAVLHAAGVAWMLVGAAVVLRLVYEEIGVVGKICAWCTAVHVLVLALLVLQVREVRPTTGS